MTRVAIAGAIAHHPFGGAGNTWAFLQYVLGLRRLGCEVLYVEHLAPDSCWDDDWKPTGFETSANVRYFVDVVARHELHGSVALMERDGSAHVGLSRREVEQWVGGADLFVNASGRFHFREILRAARRRLYLDLDPGFTQIWQAKYGVDMNLAGHDAYATVGLNLGTAGCPFPTLGLEWHHTLPPVVLDEWECQDPPGDRYTTVADWRGYSPIEWDGVWYGQKSEEFEKIIDLPRRSAGALELCLAIHPDEPALSRLLENGWQLSDPRLHARDSDTYRQFVRASRGELTAVKNGYARGRSGWISDRTVCYLAAGRPAIVQDTGVRDLPLGEGMLAFDGVEQAVAALKEVESDYPRHARRARELAREYFDSDRVLKRLLDVAGI